MLNIDILEKVKERLVRTYSPLEIYIFGSHAWGNADESSDLDLLIIVENIKKSDRYKALVQGHKALLDLDIAKDILVLSKKEFDEFSQDHRMMYYKIKNQGKKIYAKA